MAPINAASTRSGVMIVGIYDSLAYGSRHGYSKDGERDEVEESGHRDCSYRREHSCRDDRGNRICRVMEPVDEVEAVCYGDYADYIWREQLSTLRSVSLRL